MKWTGIVVLIIASVRASAQNVPFLGDWQEPGGSVVRIERCGSNLCMKISILSSTAPSTTDTHNPDASLRDRSLCNLQIGRGFHMDGATHASGGQLYDPKSGNTYHGKMTVEGDMLNLRGYVGVSLFGRTEVWRRVSPASTACRVEQRK